MKLKNRLLPQKLSSSVILPLLSAVIAIGCYYFLNQQSLDNRSFASSRLVTYSLQGDNQVAVGQSTRLSVFIPETGQKITGADLLFELTDTSVASFSGIYAGPLFESSDQSGNYLFPETALNHCQPDHCRLIVLSPCDLCTKNNAASNSGVLSCASKQITSPLCYPASRAGFIAYLDITGTNPGATELRMVSPSLTATTTSTTSADDVTDPALPSVIIQVLDSINTSPTASPSATVAPSDTPIPTINPSFSPTP